MCGGSADHNSEHQPKKKCYDYKPTKVFRLVAFVVVYGASILAGAYGFFGHHHYIAVLVGLIATIGMLYEMFHEGMIDSRVLTLLSAIVIVFCIGLGYYVGPSLPEETEIHGWMLPANAPDIPNTCNFTEGGISFVMGTNISRLAVQQRVSYVLVVNNTPLIGAERDGDKIYFDINVFLTKMVI